MPTYSIIIPHRDSPAMLARLLASIPQRDDTEVIVIDDAEGRGGGWARNSGLTRARGRWLLFADADDFYVPGFIDILDTYAVRDDIDVLYFGFHTVAADTLQPESSATAAIIQAYDGSPSAADRVRFAINSPWCKMVSAALVRQHGLRFDETSIANDRMFSLRVGHHARRIAVDKRVLYSYVHYPASQTNRHWDRRKVRDLLDVHLRSNAFLRRTGHAAFTRRTANLWVEALRARSPRRLWWLTAEYLSSLCRVTTRL